MAGIQAGLPKNKTKRNEMMGSGCCQGARMAGQTSLQLTACPLPQWHPLASGPPGERVGVGFCCRLAQASMLQRAEEGLELREEVHHCNLQHLAAEGGALQHVKQVLHAAAGRQQGQRGRQHAGPGQRGNGQGGGGL